MTTVTEPFDGTGALSANWTGFNTVGGTPVNYERDAGLLKQLAALHQHGVYWNANEFTGDQTASIQDKVLSGHSIGLVLKFSSSTGFHYFAGHGATDAYIFKLSPGVSLLTNPGGLSFAPDDIITFDAVQNGANLDLVLKKNGAVIAAHTDTAPLTGTRIGFKSYDANTTARADGFSGGDIAAVPTISAQPTAQTVTAPAAATFTASVSGTFTGLRWQRQAAGAGAWSDVAGATSASFTTGATSVTGGSWNNTDRVRLQVDWSGGTVTSTDVALTVVAGGSAPTISAQPANASVTTPAAATFTVAASGSGTLTYQWQRQPAAGGGYADISGATSASYTTPASSVTGGAANNGDTYRCVVTGDTAPPATSTAATLTVLAPLATTFTFTVNGAVSLSALKYAIFEATTPDAWVAPIKKGADETTDASGVCTVSVAGLTARRVGELGSAFVTNSDGTPTGGAQAATRRATYYVGAFA